MFQIKLEINSSNDEKEIVKKSSTKKEKVPVKKEKDPVKKEHDYNDILWLTGC